MKLKAYGVNGLIIKNNTFQIEKINMIDNTGQYTSDKALNNIVDAYYISRKASIITNLLQAVSYVIGFGYGLVLLTFINAGWKLWLVWLGFQFVNILVFPLALRAGKLQKDFQKELKEYEKKHGNINYNFN